MKRLLFSLLLLLPAGCTLTPTPPELNLPQYAVNRTGLTLRLLDIEQNITPGNTFRPTVHADITQPLQVTALKSLDQKALASNSMGMAITLHSARHKKPLHAYLITYPVYHVPGAPGRYRIRLTAAQINLAHQGKTIMAHGSYRAFGQEYLSWVMWLDRQSLDVDCGCS